MKHLGMFVVRVTVISKRIQKTDMEVVGEVFINLSSQHKVDTPDSEKESLRNELASKLNCGDKRYYRAFCASALADASSYGAKPNINDVICAYNWVGDVPMGFKGTPSDYYGGLIGTILNDYNEMMKAYD